MTNRILVIIIASEGIYHEIVRNFRCLNVCICLFRISRARNSRQGRRQESHARRQGFEEGSEERRKEGGTEGGEQGGEERWNDRRHFFRIEVPADWAGGGFGAGDVDCGESEEQVRVLRWGGVGRRVEDGE